MKLIGSTTSPYVRRIRMWAMQQQVSVDFQHIDIFSDEGRKLLLTHSPTGKIPFLLSPDGVILDSSIIFEYLNQHAKLTPMTWAEKNLLTTINAANDSGIELLLCRRSGFNVQDDMLFFNLQRQRLTHSLQHLADALNSNNSLSHPYLTVCLFCLLDWLSFREITSFEHLPKLVQFWQHHAATTSAQHTDPRLT